jgi:hypothetical protein
VVNLTAKAGFTFASVNANSFSYDGTATVTHPAGSGTNITVTISFPATEASVSALDLTALNITPVKGATPTTTINTSQYGGSISWTPADPSFAPSTAYQATVVLTATTGFTFTGVGVDSFTYTYAGTATTNPVGSGNIITVTISFPATAADVVSAFDLTALVVAPVKHETPSTAINAPQYTGIITWNPAHSPFAPSTAYQATVVLTAKSGYTFAGVSANSFSHTHLGTTVTHPAGSGNIITVTISFPATAPDVVSAFDLTTLVVAPVKHAAPATTINAPQYTGIISWTPADPSFAPSTAYQATVALTATAGYTFVGVNANNFNHTLPGTTVTHPAGSGNIITVTINFPATATEALGSENITLGFNDAGEGAFSENTLTVTKGGGILASRTITLAAPWISQQWRVDGFVKGSGASFDVDADDYTLGDHLLQVTVYDGANYWSKTLWFTVN